MAVFTDAEITPLVVAGVPFLGGITALMMVGVLMMRVNKAPSGEGAQIAIANQTVSYTHLTLPTILRV